MILPYNFTRSIIRSKRDNFGAAVKYFFHDSGKGLLLCGSPLLREIGLGLTSVKVTVSNPFDPKLGEEFELIVDTGSVLSWILRGLLEKLNIKPRRRRDFKTIEGRSILRDVGLATIKYEQYEADVEVVFAEEKDVSVLGATALESLGYRVNPITEKLEYIGLLAAQ